MSSPKLIVKAGAEKHETLFHRHAANPILTGKDWPYSVNSVFNAGATLLPDGSTLLLCRVEDRRGISHLCVSRSGDRRGPWPNRPRADASAQSGGIPRGTMGHRGSANYLRAGTQEICHCLHF